MRAPLDGIERICESGLGERELRVALLHELGRAVPFDSYAWLLTDPERCVGTSPLADVPALADLPALIRAKYLTATSRWTSLPANTATTLLSATSGDPTASRVWRELLAGYGIDDIASLVLRDQFGCWGFLDLWRAGGSFTPAECDVLSSFARIVAPASRRSLAATFAAETGERRPFSEPVVLILSDDLQRLATTARADSHLRALLPTDADRGPIPAAAYNVAAQLLAREQGVDPHPPSSRARIGDGLWVTIAAVRMIDAAPGADSIAVTIEPTPPAERSSLYARVIGLSDREAELLGHLVAGSDTRDLARRLVVSEHTVQDHLKSIFVKADVRSRRLLVARATGTG